MKRFEKLRNIPIGVIAETCATRFSCDGCPFHRNYALTYSCKQEVFLYCLAEAVIDNPDAATFLDEDIKIMSYIDAEIK